MTRALWIAVAAVLGLGAVAGGAVWYATREGAGGAARGSAAPDQRAAAAAPAGSRGWADYNLPPPGAQAPATVPQPTAAERAAQEAEARAMQQRVEAQQSALRDWIHEEALRQQAERNAGQVTPPAPRNRAPQRPGGRQLSPYTED